MIAAPRPLHVLMTTDTVGGVWSYALDLAQGLTADGLTVTLVSLGPEPSSDQRAQARADLPLELAHAGIPLDWTAANASEIRRGATVLSTLAEWSRADLIHLNHPAFAAEPLPVPVVAVAHSCVATWWRAVRGTPAFPPDFVWRSELVAEGYHAAARVIAPSAAFAEVTAQTYDLPETPAVVHNGRPLPGRALRRRAAAAPIVVTAGRLWDEGKNVLALDRAAGRLRRTIVAIGPTSGPNGDVVRLTHLKTVGEMSFIYLDQWLRSAAVFVSTARYEPFGLSVLEAAQRGCALVLADIPTFRELWHDTALFVPPDDDVAIAAAIEQVLGDAGLAKRLRAASRTRSARYSVARMVAGTREVYRAALTNRRDEGRAEVAA